VQLDRGFVLAHARLADAWAELDFTGKAQAEILRASELEIKSGLPEVDKHYVDAVRATLTFDFAGAAQDYQLVLKALPEPEKAYGYVDLGRAYEKAGNVADAMKCYSEAVRLAPEFPASLVRRGILESRNGKAAAGEADFSQADKLYSASSNMEGTAEIAYQRSYAASLVGDMTHARQYLQQSLHLAGEISSPQLEIRALTRLATVEYLSDNTDQSIQLANRSIQLAREKGLDYWAIDALVRLGNAYITLKDFDRAEPTLQEALRLAQEGQRKRPEATAQLSLASIRNLQGNPDETIALAQKALEYYKKAGFFRDSIDALTLIIRSERDKADFKKALQDSTEALQIVSKTANPSLTMQIEELAGSVLLSLERFPEAMAHFQNALSIARSIDQNIEYQTLHCADTAWQLGRYAEAEQLLQSIRPIAVKHPPIARAVARIEAQMELSKLNYPAAEQLAKRLLSEPGAVSAETAIDLQIVEGSDTRQSRAKESVSSCRSALDLSTGKKDLVRIARSNLCQAAAQMAAGSPKEAQASADAAARFFSATGLAQSEWRALLTTAKIQRELGDFEKARNNSIKALEILSGTQHSWAVSDKITFQARPDIGAANRELMQLSKN
jgi:tetratricopeptide (TPR) repeat protein